MEYTLVLQDKVSGKLRQIGIENDQQLDTWARVQTQVNAASNTMQNMGVSIGSLNERISALRAEREWIPANNIEAIRQNNIELKGLERQVRRLETVNGNMFKTWWHQLKTTVPMIGLLTNPLVLLTGGLRAVTNVVRASSQAYRERAEAETKLAQVMRNTMNASQDQMRSVVELTKAQQRLGVISSSVQLAGAQELATYVTKKESLEKLIPVMNDMLAQQYGLNASQGSAAQIATMLGRVMEGQVGALARYGYFFTDAQEQILKYGTEAQRAATLAEVVTAAVGGMNEAFAQTPEGRLQQNANRMLLVRERIGAIVVNIRAAFIPVMESVVRIIDKATTWFERHQATIIAVVRKVGGVINAAFRVVWNTIRGVGSAFTWLWERIKEGSFAVVAITGAIGALVVAKTVLIAKAKLVALWAGIVTTAKWAWVGVQKALNLVLTMNPIGLIIAAIGALIGVIAWVMLKTDGWSKQWESVVNFMRYSFVAFVERIKWNFSTAVNGIMIGINKIKLAWFRFREAVGLGDSAENQNMIAQISRQVEERQKAIMEGAARIAEYSERARNALTWELSWNRDRSLSDVTAGIRSRFGFGANDSLLGAVGGGSQGADGAALAQSNEAIVTGGTRNTNIYINFNNLVEHIVFDGTLSEKTEEMERDLAEAMFRVLNMAQSTVK